MKVLVLLGALAFVAVGCSAVPTLEQLEEQATLTGDWSAVEKREQVIARREARRGLQCPRGYVSYCEQHVGRSKCTCASNDALRSALAGIY